MKEVISIEMKLVRATSLDQLRNSEGKARMNMPYWLDIDGGKLFQFVGKHTDAEELKVRIAHGLVWIEEKYSSFSKAMEDK